NGLENCLVLQPIFAARTGWEVPCQAPRGGAKADGMSGQGLPKTSLCPFSVNQLSAIRGVDAHVFRGEIASPVAGGGATCVQVQEDMNVLFEQAVAGGALVEGEGLARGPTGKAGHVHVHTIGIELAASAAGSGKDTAPVGIAAGKGGLHKRRSGDGLADAARAGFRFRATDFDFDDALRALAVCNDLQGERVANFLQGFSKGAVRGGTGLDGWSAGGAIRENEKRVVGGSVAVNADGVKGS